MAPRRSSTVFLAPAPAASHRIWPDLLIATASVIGDEETKRRRSTAPSGISNLRVRSEGLLLRIELRVTLSPTPLRELRPDVTTRIVPEPNAGRVPGCVATSFGSNGQRHYGIQEFHLKTKLTVLVSPAPTVIFCVAVPSFSCQASMR